jgi:hypothetical protein
LTRSPLISRPTGSVTVKLCHFGRRKDAHQTPPRCPLDAAWTPPGCPLDAARGASCARPSGCNATALRHFGRRKDAHQTPPRRPLDAAWTPPSPAAPWTPPGRPLDAARGASCARLCRTPPGRHLDTPDAAQTRPDTPDAYKTLPGRQDPMDAAWTGALSESEPWCMVRRPRGRRPLHLGGQVDCQVLTPGGRPAATYDGTRLAGGDRLAVT